jgi:restriction endonuclease S subunit
MTGNTLPRLQMSDIEKLPIPVPPAPVQARIADEVQRIKSDALSLRGQAAADLERAKREIEAMILWKAAAT